MDQTPVPHTSVQTFKHRAGKAGLNRGVLVIALCALLCMIGVITYTANAWSSTRHVASHLELATSHHVAKATPVKGRPSTKKPDQRPHQTSQNATGTLNYPVYSGNTHLPEIALTFDDGPNPIYTPQVLAILQTYQIKATFFDVGYLVKDFPNIVRQEFLQGYSIGNHSWSHPQLTRLPPSSITSQLTGASDAIQAVTGTRPTIFRPPYGSFNGAVFAQAFQHHLTTVLWNNDARDWSTPGVNVIVQRVLNEARNGAIILLHDGGGFRYQTVEALPTIISALQQRGFTFVTIPQLLHNMPASGKPSPSPSPPSTDASSISTPFAPNLVVWKQE